MNIQKQDNPALSHIVQLIEDIPIAMLTTVEDDGAIASRPMAGLELDSQGVFWFFTNVHSAKVDNLRHVGLNFTDTSSGTYVALAGRGDIDADRERIARLWTPFAKPWFPDGPESPNLALLKFTPETADYWDAPNSKMVRSLGALASMVLGKPVAMGEHGFVTALSPKAGTNGGR